MFNTYGLRSININTFNLEPHGNCFYPREERDRVVTCFKIHNLCLNILGYIPAVSPYSGCVRMMSGLSICILTLCLGNPNAERGIIVCHWYNEALRTGIAQIARGAIEALPFGRAVNLSLDAIGTLSNLMSDGDRATHHIRFSYDKSDTRQLPQTRRRYSDPTYPFPFSILYLA